MVETSAPAPGPKMRMLGWVGMWLCSAALFPLLTVWAQFFNLRRRVPLPPLGSSLFWELLGADALMASLMTFSAWTERNKPPRRRTAATPRRRVRQGLAGAALLALIVLRVLAANPGAPIHWAGLLGGASALALLFALLMRCSALALPPRLPEAAPDPAALPTIPFGVRPPKNHYRAEATLREVIYRRPLSQRIGAGVGVLFFACMGGLAFGFSLLGLGLIFVPGFPMRANPAEALLMGGFFVFCVCAVLAIGASTGPRELVVDSQSQSYFYRFSAPVRWPLAGIIGDANRDELGLPWRTVECRGASAEMAGVQMRQSTQKSSTFYSLFVCWTDPSRPRLRVGFTRQEDAARAMQAQVAEDLGIDLLPDQEV